MADKKDLSLNLRSAGGSSLPMPGAGGEEFSLQPCTQAASEACTGNLSGQKRKAPTSVLDGFALKRTGEEVSEEEPLRAVDSQLTVPEGEEADDSGYDESMSSEEIIARYDATMERLFGNNPNVVWVDFPSCCVRPPGVEFPKPRTRRPDGQNDAAKEDEELSVRLR